MTIDLTKYTDDQLDEILEVVGYLTASVEIWTEQGLGDLVSLFTAPAGLKIARRVIEIATKYPELFSDPEITQTLILTYYGRIHKNDNELAH